MVSLCYIVSMKTWIAEIKAWIQQHIHIQKKPGKRLSTASAVAMTAGIFLFVLVFGIYQYRQYTGTPLNVLDDSVISFTGYNGAGTVTENFHPEQAMLEKLSETIAEKDAAGESTIYLSQLKDNIVCGFNKDSALSNDEVITYSCTIDEDIARNAGYHLVNTQKNYKVFGLSDLIPVDPFTDVSASWVMQNETADIQIVIPDNLQNLGIRYSWQPKDDTTITITASVDEQAFQEAGYVLTATSKDYVTGTKPVLIQSVDELTDAEIDAIVKEAEQLLVTELETCGYALLHDEETLTINSYEEGRLNSSYDGFTVSFTLNSDDVPWFSRFNDLTAEFAGTIYRGSDASVHFQSNTKHSCTVGGFFSLYMEEENQIP